MSWLVPVKVAVDMLLVHAGIIAAFLVRYGALPDANWQAYKNLSPWITLAAFILFYSYALYATNRRSWGEIFSALICAVAILFLVTLSLSYLLYEFAFPRFIILMAAFFQLLFLTLWRFFIWKWFLKQMGPLKLLIVGPAEDAWERATILSSESSEMYRIAGLLVDNPEKLEDKKVNVPVAGLFNKLPETLEAFQPTAVLFCSGTPHEVRLKMLDEMIAKNLPVYVIPDLYEILVGQSILEQVNGFPVFRLAGFIHRPAKLWKRAMDVGLVLLFALPAVLIVLVAAIALEVETPGAPVLFRQERVGRGGRVFKLIKLRTMIPDAEKYTGPVLSEENDSRVTSVGTFLRGTRIDELPQLWNVLRGDMSFIGPRPERPAFVREYSKEIPGYDYRHYIKSGITGLAQIEGKYSTSARDKLRFDLIYAHALSFPKDLQILLHTIKVMLMRDRAS